MKDNPKSKKPPEAAKKTGFYAALYSCVGIMLVLAVVIGYNNFAAPSTEQAKATQTPAVAQVGSSITDSYLKPGNNETGEIGTAISDENPTVNGSTAIGATNAPAAVNSTFDKPVADLPANSGTVDADVDAIDAEAKRPKETPAADALPETGTPSESTKPEQKSETNTGSEQASDVDGHNTASSEVTFSQFNDSDKMNWPVLGEIVMDYSVDHVVYDKTLDQYRTNNTLCIAAPLGTEVRAAASGIVKDITTSRENGKAVVIDHGNGWVTTYSQLQDSVAIKVGDVVSQGEIIGSVGEPSIYTVLLGDHLGFSVMNNESTINPKDVLVME